MSSEKAKEYLIHLTESDEAAKRADDAHVKALLDVSREMGYEFEEADLRTALEEMAGLGELSEEDLEAVAGGGVTYYGSGMYFRPLYRLGW